MRNKNEDGFVYFSRTLELGQTRSYSNSVSNQAYESADSVQNRALPSLPLEKLPGQYPVVDGIPQIPAALDGAAAKQYDIPRLHDEPNEVEIPSKKLKPKRLQKTPRYANPPDFARASIQDVPQGDGNALNGSNVTENDKYAALQRKPVDESINNTYAKLDKRTRDS